MRRSVLTLSVALSALLIGGGSLLAQVPPGAGGGGVGGGAGGGAAGGGSGGANAGAAGLPTKAEIEKKIKEQLDALPERTTELGRVKIIYKPVPCDPAEVIKNSGQIPQGMNPDQAVKQFLPMARPYIEKYMLEIGKLVTDVELKTKTGKLVPAEYTFGLIMDDMNPIGLLIQGKTLKSPMKLPMKPSAAQTPFGSLVIELKESKKEDEFGLEVGFGKALWQPAKIQIVKAK